MSIPIWVTDPTGNNNPYLAIIPPVQFLFGGTSSGGNSLVDYNITKNPTSIVNLQTNNPVTLPVLGLAFGANVWIALINTVSSGNSINGTIFYKSTDQGKTWASVFTAAASANPSGGNDSPDQIVFGNGIFLAVNTSAQNPSFKGLGGTIWTSSDGTHWSSATNPINGSNFGAASLSFANGKFFIGVSDMTSVNSYFFSSPTSTTWTQSGTAFNNLQGQIDIFNNNNVIPVSQVLPGNVAYSTVNQIYAASAQYASNGYFWLTVCNSGDGLTWGSGKQFGNFTAVNPNVESGQGPVTQYQPSFANYNCVCGNGTFIVPVLVQTANLLVSTTSATGQNFPPNPDFITTHYSNNYSQNDVGVLVSNDGASWTFNKILAGPMTAIPSATYQQADFEFSLIGYNAVDTVISHLVSYSSGQFVFVANTVLGYGIANYQTSSGNPPTFNFVGAPTQQFFTGANGTSWTRVASFSAPNSSNLSAIPTPDIMCIGVGPVSTS